MSNIHLIFSGFLGVPWQVLYRKGKASGCGDGSGCMTRNLRDMQAVIGGQVTRNLDYSTMSMTQRSQCGAPDIENYQLFPGEPKWEKNT